MANTVEVLKALSVLFGDPSGAEATVITRTREKAIDARNRLRDPEKALSWIRVIYRHCIYRLGVEKGRNKRPCSLDALSSVVQPCLGTRSPSSLIDEKEQMSKMWREVMKLSEREQKIINMRHMDGMTFDAISTALDWPLASVTSSYYRALVKLRAGLKTP